MRLLWYVFGGGKAINAVEGWGMTREGGVGGF